MTFMTKTARCAPVGRMCPGLVALSAHGTWGHAQSPPRPLSAVLRAKGKAADGKGGAARSADYLDGCDTLGP